MAEEIINTTVERTKSSKKHLERTLPYDIEAEAAVLSAMMVDNYSVARGIEIISETSFYKASHRIIFNCIKKLFEDNVEVDIITLIHKLEESGQLKEAGGSVYINELSDKVLSSANIEYHARILISKALLRNLISISNEIIKSAYEPEMPAQDIVDWAEQKIFEVAEMPLRKTLVKMGDVLPETVRIIEETSKNQTNVVGLSSGFNSLDNMVGGFRKGQFIVVASRPAMGKTSFALNIATHNALHRKLKVAVFTLEMATEELLLRIISSEARVSMNTLLKGYGMDSEKMMSITQVAHAYSNVELYIDDMGTNTVMSIKAKTRRLCAKLGGLDLILIDYLQLMTSGNPKDSRQQEISDISRGLKVLAKEMDLPVIALSQLNRSLESRKDDERKPRLSDLRESGAIEQDADVVMFLYRDDYYNKDNSKTPGIAEVIIGKNRHGAIGSVNLEFQKEFTKFKDIEDENNRHF